MNNLKKTIGVLCLTLLLASCGNKAKKDNQLDVDTSGNITLTEAQISDFFT